MVSRVVLLALCFQLFAVHEANCSRAERRLFSHLFSQYDKRIRPVSESNEPLKLALENLHLKRLVDVDEDRKSVDIGIWVGLSWNDSELAWNPKDYNNIPRLSVRATEIWTPDILLFSGWGVAEASLRDSLEHDVELMASGQIFYFVSLKLTLPCLNVTATGSLECNFAFGSWTQLTDTLDLRVEHKHWDLTEYVMDPKYAVESNCLSFDTFRLKNTRNLADLADSLEVKTIVLPAYPNEPWQIVIARLGLDKI